jgi:hypothetical protein
MKKINEQQEYISNGKYKSFDFTDFTYNKNADADQKQYQENILTPLANIITNEEQYKIFVTEINLKNIKDNSIKHIANTFTMIDDKNNPKKYNKITENIKDQVTNIEAKNDVITITQDT